MKMKSLTLAFVSAFSLLSVFSANAQDSKAIIRGGVNLANVSINDDGDVNDAKMLTTFQVGVIGDLKLLPSIYLQPGLLFTGKGTKMQSGEPEDANYFRATTNPYYLEVPVNLVFKTPGEGARFFVGAGPYVAMGIAGKNKAEGKILGTPFESENKIEWSSDDPTTGGEEGAGLGIMKRFDYGLNGTIGIESTNMVVSANYGLGLAKLQSGSDSDNDQNNKHRVLSLTLGFKF